MPNLGIGRFLTSLRRSRAALLPCLRFAVTAAPWASSPRLRFRPRPFDDYFHSPYAAIAATMPPPTAARTWREHRLTGLLATAGAEAAPQRRLLLRADPNSFITAMTIQNSINPGQVSAERRAVADAFPRPAAAFRTHHALAPARRVAPRLLRCHFTTTPSPDLPRPLPVPSLNTCLLATWNSETTASSRTRVAAR